MTPIQLHIEIDYVRPEPVTALAPLAEMLRLATDMTPDCGDRPDLTLGPWAEEVDRHTLAHRHALMIAIANWCFCGEIPHERALHIWSAGIHAPHTDVRRPFRAVRRAPYVPWYITGQQEGRWLLESPIALAQQWIPTGPVHLDEWGSVTGKAPSVGDTLCARVAPAGDQWFATLPLLIPGQVPQEVLRSWLVPMAEQLQARSQYPTVENLLRDHGHDLVRHVHIWAWEQQLTSTDTHV